MTKLLLVEDHEELWDFLSRRLRKRGFEVVLAHDGKQALEQVETQTPDLVLLDMDLPIMDGWTVARTLRERSDTTPIIALTAHAMSGDKEKAIAAGCDDYHAKPVDFSRLLNQVDEGAAETRGSRRLIHLAKGSKDAISIRRRPRPGCARDFA